MKNFRLKASVFILTFTLGVAFVSFLVFVNRSNFLFGRTTCFDSTREPAKITPQIRKKQFDIEVKFKKFVPTSYGLAVDFEIINKGTVSVFYSAPSRVNDDSPAFTLTEVKVGGELIDEWQCRTGLINFELKSKESKVFRLDGGALSSYWKKGKTMQVGFYLKKTPNQDFETHWGEILPITDAIEKKLLTEQKTRK